MRPTADVKQRLFSVQETAKIISRSVQSLWRDIKAKRLDVVYIAGSTRVTGENIERVCTPSKSRDARRWPPQRKPPAWALRRGP